MQFWYFFLPCFYQGLGWSLLQDLFLHFVLWCGMHFVLRIFLDEMIVSKKKYNPCLRIPIKILMTSCGSVSRFNYKKIGIHQITSKSGLRNLLAKETCYEQPCRCYSSSHGRIQSWTGELTKSEGRWSGRRSQPLTWGFDWQQDGG